MCRLSEWHQPDALGQGNFNPADLLKPWPLCGDLLQAVELLESWVPLVLPQATTSIGFCILCDLATLRRDSAQCSTIQLEAIAGWYTSTVVPLIQSQNFDTADLMRLLSSCADLLSGPPAAVPAVPAAPAGRRAAATAAPAAPTAGALTGAADQAASRSNTSNDLIDDLAMQLTGRLKVGWWGRRLAIHRQSIQQYAEKPQDAVEYTDALCVGQAIQAHHVQQAARFSLDAAN